MWQEICTFSPFACLEQPEDYEYCYKIGGKIVPDPYGKAFSGREHWSVSKGKEKRTICLPGS